MKFNPDIHHRESIRLKDFDYSSNGAYFITICTRDRECLFRGVTDGDVSNNFAAKMIDIWWRKIPGKYANILLDDFVIMPNHFHGIVLNVGANLCVRPGLVEKTGQSKAGRHMGLPLHRVVQWFKTMTTNEYIRNVKQNNWPVFNGSLWQRNYYEHIIRNEEELNKIREYIRNNPLNWQIDDYFVD